MYADLKKAELVELARGRGLPVSGNVEELIARLEEADDNDLLKAAADQAPEPAPEAAPEAAPEPVPATEGADTPAGRSEALGDPTEGPDDPSGAGDDNPPPPPGPFIAEYPLPREGHTTELHFQLLRRVVEDAFAAGRVARAQTARCVGVLGWTVRYEVLCR